MHCISCALKRKVEKPLLFKQTLKSRFTCLACQHFSFDAKKSLDRERPFSLALRVVSIFSCLSCLAPSVTRVATCVSHVLLDRLQKKERLLLSRAISHARGHLRVSRFARPTTEKRETARSLGDEQRNKNKKKNIESRCFCLSHVRFFFLPGSCPVPTDSVRCCEFFLALGRCLDKHKRAFSLVEQCRVTSWPCPYIKGYEIFLISWLRRAIVKRFEAFL